MFQQLFLQGCAYEQKIRWGSWDPAPRAVVGGQGHPPAQRSCEAWRAPAWICPWDCPVPPAALSGSLLTQGGAGIQMLSQAGHPGAGLICTHG